MPIWKDNVDVLGTVLMVHAEDESNMLWKEATGRVYFRRDLILDKMVTVYRRPGQHKLFFYVPYNGQAMEYISYGVWVKSHPYTSYCTILSEHCSKYRTVTNWHMFRWTDKWFELFLSFYHEHEAISTIKSCFKPDFTVCFDNLFAFLGNSLVSWYDFLHFQCWGWISCRSNMEHYL